jgi:HAMP domain-containing protein
MKNSEDRNKKVVIIKFLLISLVILAFVLFYLFYSLSVLSQASTNLSNYQILGRRPALIRNSKLLITEYLINPLYNPLATSANTIKNMNINIINEFYNLEASLLYLNLGTSQSAFNNYNNGDICLMISTFSSFSIFNEKFSAT